jgi:hypothetical protein
LVFMGLVDFLCQRCWGPELGWLGPMVILRKGPSNVDAIRNPTPHVPDAVVA